MSHYAYEVQEATAYLDGDLASNLNLVEKIKNVARTEKWCGYGWRDRLLEAKSIFEIARIFGIQLVDEGMELYRPVIDGAYVSNFFKELIDLVAPFMTDGEINVDDEYNIVTIQFEDGNVSVWRE